MYRELIAEALEGHAWARLQKLCPERELKKTEQAVGYVFPHETFDCQAAAKTFPT